MPEVWIWLMCQSSSCHSNHLYLDVLFVSLLWATSGQMSLPVTYSISYYEIAINYAINSCAQEISHFCMTPGWNGYFHMESIVINNIIFHFPNNGQHPCKCCLLASLKFHVQMRCLSHTYNNNQVQVRVQRLKPLNPNCTWLLNYLIVIVLDYTWLLIYIYIYYTYNTFTCNFICLYKNRYWDD